MKKTILIALTVAMSAVAMAAKPFVIPELRQWSEASGEFTVKNNTKIIVQQANQAELLPVANALAADAKSMFGLNLPVSVGDDKDGAIYFELRKLSVDNQEAYELKSDQVKGLKIAAPAKVGAYWATRSLLQIMEQTPLRTVAAGVALDYPAYPLRGFMLDAARKYFPLEFLQQYVKFMSYYKMNTFQVHLNDNAFVQFYNNDWSQTYSAFRLESETFPGLAAKDGHYTKEEFRNLQILGENNFVTVIPEIDAPAHTLAFTQYKPEIISKEYGADHIDLFNPETYKFFDALYKEYLEGENPVFRGPYVHIGTDEYSNKDQAVVEKFRHFTNHYIEYIESFGKKPMLWGALTHAKGATPVKVDNVLMACWYNGYAAPDSMMKLGYDVFSVPDGYLYIVPLAGYYRDYLDIKNLYEKWTPANIGNKTFDADNKQIKGGMFAVWNDHAGNGISTRDVHHRVWPAMQTLAVKMWNGTHATLSFEQFNAKRELLSEAPGVNLLGRAAKGVVLDLKSLKAGQTTPLNEIGYDYRVSMNVLAKAPIDKCAILTSNADATVYLTTPETGKVGFSRDGYIFDFNYKIPVGRSVKIAIEGTSKSTKLFVDDKLVEALDITYIKFERGDHNSKRALIKTLQFPLASVGSLGGVVVTNFAVTKL